MPTLNVFLKAHLFSFFFLPGWICPTSLHLSEAPSIKLVFCEMVCIGSRSLAETMELEMKMMVMYV